MNFRTSIQRLDVTKANDAAEFTVSRYSKVSVHLSEESGGGLDSGTGVVTLERSINGRDWDAFASAQTFTAAGSKYDLDVAGADKIRARVSTSSGSGSYVNVDVFAYDDTGGN